MFTENLKDYFNEFAVPAIWQSQTIQVILDEAYEDSFGVEGYAPNAYAIEAEMPNVLRNQTILIKSKTYIIAQPPRSDGQGMLQLMLEVQ